MDPNGNPTFRYTIGEISIEDTPVPKQMGEKFVLERIITVSNPTDQPLIWQIAEGDIRELDGGYKIDKVSLAIEGAACELLKVQKALRAVIPPGNHKMTETIRW